MGRPPRSVEERFWEKVGPHDDPNVCWLWTASVRPQGKGYGQFWDGVKMVYAHRFSYEMHYHVTIPEGMTIDHVKARGCTSTLCVNPYHLEVVAQKVNVLRGGGPTSLNAKIILCPKEHPYSEENTYVTPDGRRDCHACKRERYYAKKEAMV